MAAINTLLKQIYINSSAPYRDVGGTDEDFTVTEVGRHFGPPLAPKRVKLACAAIPYTWYNVTSSNNTFSFTDASGTYNIVITPGNYDATSLASAIATLMNGVGSPLTYVVTASPTTFKITFTTTGNFNLDFNVANSADLLLGFLASTVTAPALTVTAPNILGLVSDNEIFICTDLISGADNGLIPWTPGPAASSNRHVLANVTISASYGSILTTCGNDNNPFFDMRQSPYVAAAISRSDTPPPRRMHFWLEFPSGLPVSLNGSHWSMTLIFDFGSEINI